MSRFEFDDYDLVACNLWWANIERASNGKHGQKILREMREALLSMPNRRLIEGAIYEDGEVCAVGALALHRLRRDGQIKLKGHADALATEADLSEEAGGFSDEYETMDFGKSLGITGVLAWRLAYINDEEVPGGSRATPEERWQYVFNEIEKLIKPEPQEVAA